MLFTVVFCLWFRCVWKRKYMGNKGFAASRDGSRELLHGKGKGKREKGGAAIIVHDTPRDDL